MKKSIKIKVPKEWGWENFIGKSTPKIKIPSVKIVSDKDKDAEWMFEMLGWSKHGRKSSRER